MRKEGGKEKIEHFIVCLVKMVKIVRFYPDSNPMCHRAVQDCLENIARIEEKEGIEIEVTPDGLSVNGHFFPLSSLWVSQLHRWLYILGIQRIIFQPATTEWEMKNLCDILMVSFRRTKEKKDAPSMFAQRGVEHIKVMEFQPPAVIETDQSPAGVITSVVARRKEQMQKYVGWPSKTEMVSDKHEQRGKKVNQVKDKISTPEGLDSFLAASFPHIYKKDAAQWGQLVGEEIREVQQILEVSDGEQKSEVFSIIASSVRGMSSESKSKLIRSCLLPALLEDREEAEVLRFLPDEELSHSLSLLRKGGVSPPGSLARALKNLHIPPRREALLFSLAGDEPERKQDDVDPQQWLREYNVEFSSKEAKSLPQIVSRLKEIDSTEVDLQCLVNLVHLEEDIDTCSHFTQRIYHLLEDLVAQGRWKNLACWLNRLRNLIDRTPQRKAVVGGLVKEMLSSFACSDLVKFLVEKCYASENQEQEKPYLDVLAALGDFVLPSLVELLARENSRSIRRTVVNIMLRIYPSYHIEKLSPYLHHEHWYVTRNIVWLLGRVGKGAEELIIRALDYPHPKVRKEAIRSLALIASKAAIDKIMFLLESEDMSVRRMAADHLGYLPKPALPGHTINLLSRSDFLRRDVLVTFQLLEVARRMKNNREVLRVLRKLSFLRFYFWNPKLLRVGFKARRVLKSG